MAQNKYARLQGLKVSLSGETGAFRICPHCKNDTAKVVLHVRGPHRAHLRCFECKTLTAWIGEIQLATLNSQYKEAS